MSTPEEMAILRRMELALADNTAKTEKLLQAFPGGVTDGHRRYHESVIEWQELRNKLVREALIKVAQGGAMWRGTVWRNVAQ